MKILATKLVKNLLDLQRDDEENTKNDENIVGNNNKSIVLMWQQ